MWLFFTGFCRKDFVDNHFHYILRLFDALPNFLFTAINEARLLVKTFYILVALEVAK